MRRTFTYAKGKYQYAAYVYMILSVLILIVDHGSCSGNEYYCDTSNVMIIGKLTTGERPIDIYYI